MDDHGSGSEANEAGSQEASGIVLGGASRRFSGSLQGRCKLLPSFLVEDRLSLRGMIITWGWGSLLKVLILGSSLP